MDLMGLSACHWPTAGTEHVVEGVFGIDDRAVVLSESQQPPRDLERDGRRPPEQIISYPAAGEGQAPARVLEH
jgi:hypothetical protein